MIDWKSLVSPLIKSVLTVVLTMIATKWADAATVVAKLMAGDTVSLWNGAVNLSFAQIQLWLTAGIIAVVSAVLGWMHRVKMKREANIALALPKGATKADVKAISEESPVLSAHPDAAAIRTANINLSGR